MGNKNSRRALAHSPNKDHHSHDLVDHLTAVAHLAKQFADKFDAGDLAYWAGLWHDLGKFNPAFQAYLKTQAEGLPALKVPHAVWGAILAYRILFKNHLPWEEIVLPIAGHHVGLKDPGYLLGYMHEQSNTQEAKALIRSLQEAARGLPQPRVKPVNKSGMSREVFIRMHFSTMVDADYLDTEEHFDPKKASLRSSAMNIKGLFKQFEWKQERFLKSEKAKKDTLVNQMRREVYEACLKSAEGHQGIYRLTVPTGGGKTRSGLGFALKHASKYDLRRVVVVIPYTSIIEQTVQVYRDILGDEAVVEHHSNVPWVDDEDLSEAKVRLRLASENWDAPLIVTTTVQLFESLFSNRPGRCRKLHNLVGSVILLDEVQTLPVELLEPTLDMLRTLVEEYEVTVVLSTATQPAFAGESPYLKGFAGLQVGEIVADRTRLFEVLKGRVEYEWISTPTPWEELAEELRDLPQVMVVLNTRRDAIKLVDLLKGKANAVRYLSTFLCSAHRRQVLQEVRDRLEARMPVQLISTQVVEAGVDLDFPVVYRAIGPLDRIVQVAGRCNREGKLERGKVIVFETSEKHAPKGPYRTGIRKARSLLRQYGIAALENLDLLTLYFHRLYQDESLDAQGVQEQRQVLNYPEVAKRYRLIKNDTAPVVVQFKQALRLVSEWQREGPSRKLWRKLQGYVVNLYQRDVDRLLKEEWIREEEGGLYIWEGTYDDSEEGKGLDPTNVAYDPCDLYQED